MAHSTGLRLGAASARMNGLRALEAVLREWPGFRLFTALALDEARGVRRRIHSSDPAGWPLGGEKPLRSGDAYHTALVLERRARLVEGREAIAAAFPDHALILALGCECAVNLPVRQAGRVLGALNLLDRAGAYAAADLPRLQTVADGAATLLLAEAAMR